MLSKYKLVSLVFSLLSMSEQALGRKRWLERDNRAVYLYPRRPGQEQPDVLQRLSTACPSHICSTLAGQAVTPLLASQPECSQQDLADAIIDASKQLDAATQANVLALAIEYRQVEKNTPPDFTANPPSLRNSVFCQKAPKNPELNGLVQAQDPANDPNLFFDPATNATVKKGDQPNTSPFRGAVAPALAVAVSDPVAAVPTAVLAVDASVVPCVTRITITVSGTSATVTASNAVTISVGGTAAATTSAPAGATATPAPPATGDFGKCPPPEIEFGLGFNDRKGTSFQPVNLTFYNHGSDPDIEIIIQYICNTLVSPCGADQLATETCASASAAASAAPANTGAQADAFNAAFGIITDFANTTVVDDQGQNVTSTRLVATTVATSSSAAPNTFVASASSSRSASTTLPPAITIKTSISSGTTSSTTSDAAATTTSSASATATAIADNLQTFTGALGDIQAPAVTALPDGKFQVIGNSIINDKPGALNRSCDVQQNQCSDAANASGNKGGFTVAACSAQLTECNAADT